MLSSITEMTKAAVQQLQNVKFKSPSIVTRTKKVYVIGDSLVANYYGTALKVKKVL